MCSSRDDSIISMEEVEKALLEIENRYSHQTINSSSQIKKDSFEETLSVLSMEFDSLGLPVLDLTQSLPKIMKQLVNTSRSLVQIHRKTISEIKDVNIENRRKDTRSNDLYKRLDDYKLKLNKSEERCSILKNQITRLNEDKAELLKKELTFKEELDRTKRFFLSKQNELQHNMKKLAKEHQQSKEMFGQDLNSNNSANDVALKLIKKYKHNEEIYKNTIQTLQENNKELLDEIFNLKEELVCSN